MAFCKEYNAQTSKMVGEIVPVEITVYEVSDYRVLHLPNPSPPANLFPSALIPNFSLSPLHHCLPTPPLLTPSPFHMTCCSSFPTTQSAFSIRHRMHTSTDPNFSTHALLSPGPICNALAGVLINYY